MNMAKKRNTRKIATKNENENPRVPSKCVCTTENTWQGFQAVSTHFRGRELGFHFNFKEDNEVHA